MARKVTPEQLGIGLSLLAIITILMIVLIPRKKKGTLTILEKYRAKADAFAYYVTRSDSYEYGWNPNFSKAAKTFKAGEVVGDAVGYFPTTNATGKEFTFLVFEVPFVYGTTIFLCVDKVNLSLIQ